MEERLNKIISLKEAIKLYLEKIKEKQSSKKSDSETDKKDKSNE